MTELEKIIELAVRATIEKFGIAGLKATSMFKSSEHVSLAEKIAA